MDADSMGMFTTFINAVGFPIFVAVWMLWKGSADNKEIKESINQQTLVVTQLVTLIEDMKKSG